MRSFRICLVVILLIMLSHAIFAADPFPVPRLPYAPRSMGCYYVPTNITIDGKLDEASWSSVPWSTDFIDIEGELKSKPRYRTRVKMQWDSTALYIAAELEEPHLWATYAQRDMVIFHENDFEVFIDPDGDAHNYYELEMNALNTVWDLLLTKPYRDNGNAVDHWNIGGLRTAVSLQGTLNNPSDVDKGWTLEIALPWDALSECANRPTPPRAGDQWRVNFSRVEWQIHNINGKYEKRVSKGGQALPEDNWVWTPQGLIAMHYPERWGIVEFYTTGYHNRAEPIVDTLAIYRSHLYEVYYSQREYQRVHGAYSNRMNELNLPATWSTLPSVETTHAGFLASLVIHDSTRACINEEGRFFLHR